MSNENCIGCAYCEMIGDKVVWCSCVPMKFIEDPKKGICKDRREEDAMLD